ncbi:HlyD family type I secretion periplasmic adaptor subunit [Pedomonas mirosovicensis]|uniref:HlyD family type I secretion periplasmic adaptor subunit n=1 Tax=Pedomonas mirosovicensis TaxID=2908641 RepID=UPI0021690A53|nr:HlyD family type I secretion periplasmic adaptor subunit [Pedomonas mirosovicensis]MCH8686608.1 HlyD family type I secretion periplasmic adaptor subunit [Pedomonas mirosovicensis]
MTFATLSEKLPGFAHHWRVLRAAWAQENERSAHEKPQEETQFLPAALEIIETPPSPMLRALLLALCGLVVLALLWSIIGKLDTVAVAAGRTIPEGYVKVISWGGVGSEMGSTGIVRAIHVREGQRVEKGQLLIELDPTVAGADAAQAERSLLSAEVEKARAAAIVAYLNGKPPVFNPPEGAPVETIATQRTLISALIAEYEAKRASLLQTREEHQSELAGAELERTKLEETLPFLEKQVLARRQLAEKGLSSKLLLWELEEQFIDRKRSVEVQEKAAAKARAAIASINEQLAQLRQEFARQTLGGLVEAQDQASLSAEEIKKADQRRVLQELRAPVAGTVQQLAVHTIGGVVQQAQPLMMIVPDGGNLIVEAQILNKDMGFVREGQPVAVKLEAFSFTEYGYIEGVLEHISPDALQDEKKGLVYTARVRLKQKTITANGRTIPLTPGMAVQADIKTGERRIIQYLLSPIMKTIEEAGRER